MIRARNRQVTFAALALASISALAGLAGCKKAAPVGSFAGQVTEGALSYPMTVVLTPTGGTVSYAAPFDCKGLWELTGHERNSWHYKERITEQKGTRRCADGETATLAEDSKGVYVYTEGAAHTTLTKR